MTISLGGLSSEQKGFDHSSVETEEDEKFKVDIATKFKNIFSLTPTRKVVVFSSSEAPH